MRKLGIFGAAALTAVSFVYGESPAPAPAATGKPVIECATPKFDFGRVIQGKVVEHAFVIANKGNTILNIKGVQPSCGCTTAPITKNAIEPGQTAEIQAKFDSTRFDGPIHKTINVTSDDPDKPVFTLELTGTVTKIYEITPSHVSFGRVNKNLEFETQLVVKGLEGHKPQITGVAIEGDATFEGRYVKKQDSDEYLVYLKLKPQQKAHFSNGTIVVSLSDKDVPTLKIPFNGQVTGDISIFPPRLQFGKLKANDQLPRPVILTIENPDVAVQSVDVQPDVFSYTKAPREGTPNASEIRLQIKQTAQAGPVEGKLTIKTNSKDPEHAMIEIPLTGTIIQ